MFGTHEGPLFIIQPRLKMAADNRKGYGTDIQKKTMEFQWRESVSENMFCLLPHFHDLHIPATVVQVIGGIVDHGLPQVVDGGIIQQSGKSRPGDTGIGVRKYSQNSLDKIHMRMPLHI